MRAKILILISLAAALIGVILFYLNTPTLIKTNTPPDKKPTISEKPVNEAPKPLVANLISLADCQESAGTWRPFCQSNEIEIGKGDQQSCCVKLNSDNPDSQIDDINKIKTDLQISTSDQLISDQQTANFFKGVLILKNDNIKILYAQKIQNTWQSKYQGEDLPTCAEAKTWKFPSEMIEDCLN